MQPGSPIDTSADDPSARKRAANDPSATEDQGASRVADRGRGWRLRSRTDRGPRVRARLGGRARTRVGHCPPLDRTARQLQTRIRLDRQINFRKRLDLPHANRSMSKAAAPTDGCVTPYSRPMRPEAHPAAESQQQNHTPRTACACPQMSGDVRRCPGPTLGTKGGRAQCAAEGSARTWRRASR